jgi:hypothetical protein
VFSHRILDVEKDENFTLALSSQFGYHANESIMSITYSASKGIIAAGTDKGNVAMWKFMQNKVKFGDPESSWQLLHSKFLQETPITEIKVIGFAFFLSFGFVFYFYFDFRFVVRHQLELVMRKHDHRSFYSE